MTDSDFIKFQDDFYDLLEKYGVKQVDGDHTNFDEICEARNNLSDFVDKLKTLQLKKELKEIKDSQ